MVILVSFAPTSASIFFIMVANINVAEALGAFVATIGFDPLVAFFPRVSFWSVLLTMIVSPSISVTLSSGLARSDTVCAHCERRGSNRARGSARVGRGGVVGFGASSAMDASISAMFSFD